MITRMFLDREITPIGFRAWGVPISRLFHAPMQEQIYSNILRYFDTKLDPVRIVLAAPKELLVDGKLPTDRHLVLTR